MKKHFENDSCFVLNSSKINCTPHNGYANGAGSLPIPNAFFGYQNYLGSKSHCFDAFNGLSNGSHPILD